MTCREFHENVAAWALGTLDAREAAACEEHLRESTHEGCAEALAHERATVAAMDEALPPLRREFADVERRIEAKPRARRSAWRLVPALALAAALLLTVFRLAQIREQIAQDQIALRNQRAAAQAERDRCIKDLRTLRDRVGLPHEVVALLERPDTRVAPLAPQPGRNERATAIVNLVAGRAFIVSSVAAPPADKDLQLWIIRGKAAPVPAGFLRASGGVLVGEFDRAVLAAGPPDALAVSLEPAGGRPTPTQVVLVGLLGG